MKGMTSTKGRRKITDNLLLSISSSYIQELHPIIPPSYQTLLSQLETLYCEIKSSIFPLRLLLQAIIYKKINMNLELLGIYKMII